MDEVHHLQHARKGVQADNITAALRRCLPALAHCQCTMVQLQIAKRELHRQCTTLLAIELDALQEIALALLAAAQLFGHQADGLIALHQRPRQKHEPDHGSADSVLNALHRESI